MKTTLFLCLALALGACGGDDGNTTPKDGGVQHDGPAPTDGGLDGNNVTIDASCFDLSTITSPTNSQIINACTTADKIFKDSHPPLEGSDGSLPPLGSGT